MCRTNRCSQAEEKEKEEKEKEEEQVKVLKTEPQPRGEEKVFSIILKQKIFE